MPAPAHSGYNVEIFPAVGEKLGISFLNGWLADAKTGLWGLVILTTWQMSGYMMIARFWSYSLNVLDSVRKILTVKEGMTMGNIIFL